MTVEMATKSRNRPDSRHAQDAVRKAIPLGDGRQNEASDPSSEADLIVENTDGDSAGSLHKTRRETLEPGRSLVLSDFAPPPTNAADRFIRFAYRMGVSGSTLSAPFAKPVRPRLLATVDTPLIGDRSAGVALRAGHFLIHGVKAPIAQLDFSPSARLSAPFDRVIHGFGWMRDLAASATREQGASTAERVLSTWLSSNPRPGKGPPWHIEHAGQRLLNWLVHAPLILSAKDAKLRGQVMTAVVDTARWLDRNVAKAPDRLGEVAGWCGLVAAGLLLPEGKPRRLFAEAGLIRALGELVADDGGVLSRSPLAQMDAIAMLVDVSACYTACDRDPPAALATMLDLLVPPLLNLVHSDGALGSWQGAGAVRAHRIAALIEASGVRTRPLKDVRQWGYQRVARAKTTLILDAAPPPLARNARFGCASTLAFEFCPDGQRLIVNCGGAAFAGGQVPARVEQGLRATAAHSTLTLDDANSTAVHINGKLGAGVNEVEVDRRSLQLDQSMATRLEAAHDGYVARFGLNHRRVLIMREDGSELRGEDMLIPAGKKGTRGKIGFAIRFHIGPNVELRLSDDGNGAGMALPDGSLWQFRLATNEHADAGELAIEESMWVDGNGRPQPIQQLVVQGITSRSGRNFSWLFKKMG
ncbi:MAG: heparinase II/III family protein [Pontixanthobacter sp.]